MALDCLNLYVAYTHGVKKSVGRDVKTNVVIDDRVTLRVY
jgi:hypothetical protein